MKKNTGFTLIELMVAMAMMAIILSIGVPQLKVYFQGNRMVTNVNDLVTALHLARSEAIKRGSRVSVCKSSNADTAAPTCNPAANWEDGWLVFSDSTGGVGVYDSATEALIRIHPGAEGTESTIRPQQASIVDYVSFTSRGVPKLAGGGTQSGVFSVCDLRGLLNADGRVIARGVELNAAGRVRSTNDAVKIVTCS